MAKDGEPCPQGGGRGSAAFLFTCCSVDLSYQGGYSPNDRGLLGFLLKPFGDFFTYEANNEQFRAGVVRCQRDIVHVARLQ